MSNEPLTATPAPGTDRWYLRSAGTVRGPYRWETIATNFYLERVRESDEVSADQRLWLALADIVSATGGTLAAPPADLLGGGVAVGSGADDTPEPDHARVASGVKLRRARSERVWSELRGLPRGSIRPLLIAAAVVVVVIALGFVASHRPTPLASDCDSAPAPGSNWDFCAKAGLLGMGRDLSDLSARNVTLTGARLERATLVRADLSYAELTGADLSLSDLSGARMLGASLRNASLNHAQLVRADLRFADLTDAQLMGAEFTEARLDHAIWSNGRVCAANSVGRCVER